MSELLANLNPRQLEAVTAPERSVLILAGAGSGKTRVLTTRIAYLLTNHMASTADILAVTFTNKAAKEMLMRIEAMMPLDLRRMWIGTFHGLCNRLLRRHAEEAGLPKTFQILDQSDQLSAIKRVMKTMGVDPETNDPKSIQSMINWHKENGLRASMLGNDEMDKTFRAVYQAYEQQCQREGVVDFAELLLRCYELLERNEIVRTHYQARFRHILVDEFQDTNVLQYRWLQLLAGMGQGADGASRNAVFAVGDDDQSIYAFRGANVGNMSDFLSDFRVETPIRLEENYRSSGNILDAANALIAKNPQRLGKNLWTSSGHGEKIQLREFESDRDEARFVVEEIISEKRRGKSYRDFAVLYRSNMQSRPIEQALAQAGVPYRVYGGLRFFDRAEVKHMLAYLRLIDNPGDDTCFLRVVNFPTRGIGAKTLDALSDSARCSGRSLWETLSDRSVAHPAKLLAFRDLIEKMRDDALDMALPELIAFVAARSGLEEHYRNDREGEERLANIQEIRSSAVGYLDIEGIAQSACAFKAFDENDMTPLQGFLTQATLEAGEKNEGDDQDCVHLMTVHAAKGLEFYQVFITGLEEGLFPHFAAAKDPNGTEEERRLMYVAITRAKKRLFITYTDVRMLRGHLEQCTPSSFLDEIPPELMESKTVVKRRVQRSFSYEDEDQSAGYGYSRQKSRSSYSSASRDGWSGNERSFSGGGYRQPGSAYSSGYRSEGTTQYREEPLVAKVSSRVSGYMPGDLVKHQNFGEGVVQKLVGAGDDMRITVRFSDRTRELLLKIAEPRMSKL